MSVTKRILVLANSVKASGRCLAGREVFLDSTQNRLGGWIRPVTKHRQGELGLGERQYRGGKLVQVFDVADVDLTAPTRNPFQPENWDLAQLPAWGEHSLGHGKVRRTSLEEKPDDLWLEPGSPSDRVSHAFLLQTPPKHSLYVIRPEWLLIRLQTLPPLQRGSKPKVRQRCRFAYRGIAYDFSLTDPVVWERYESQVPALGRQAVNVRFPVHDRLLLCVSLADNFNGYHYKVVTTIFEDLV